jgi:hypothetical protein
MQEESNFEDTALSFVKDAMLRTIPGMSSTAALKIAIGASTTSGMGAGTAAIGNLRPVDEGYLRADGKLYKWVEKASPDLDSWATYVLQCIKDGGFGIASENDLIIGISGVVHAMEAAHKLLKKNTRNMATKVFSKHEIVSFLSDAIKVWMLVESNKLPEEAYDRSELRNVCGYVMVLQILEHCMQSNSSGFIASPSFYVEERRYKPTWTVGYYIEWADSTYSAPLIYTDGKLLKRDSEIFQQSHASEIRKLRVADLRKLAQRVGVKLEGVASDGFDIVNEDCLISSDKVKGLLHFNRLDTIKIDAGTGEVGFYAFGQVDDDTTFLENGKNESMDNCEHLRMPPFVMAVRKSNYNKGGQFFEEFVLPNEAVAQKNLSKAVSKRGEDFAELLIRTFQLSDSWLTDGRDLTVAVGLTGLVFKRSAHWHTCML